MNEKTTCTNENKVGNITSKVTYEIEHKKNYQVINGISYHFNDKEEVLKCINKCN